MKSYIGVMLTAALMLPATISAQDQEKKPVQARGSVIPVPLPPGGPPPRMSDGHVDLSGVWFPGPTGKANAWSTLREEGPKQEPIPFQPWAKAKRDAMTRVELELSSANVNCTPVGTPGMFTDNAYVHMIDTKPGLFIHLIENNNRWNVVHTDGRPHKPKEEQEPLFYGDQTAKWEGDTLVIDTVGFNGFTRLDTKGNPHSDKLHMVQKLTRTDAGHITYKVTVEDPVYYATPFTNERTFTIANTELLEYSCEENNRSLWEGRIKIWQVPGSEKLRK